MDCVYGKSRVLNNEMLLAVAAMVTELEPAEQSIVPLSDSKSGAVSFPSVWRLCADRAAESLALALWLQG